MNTIDTPKGELKLLPPSTELLMTIRTLLPFGAVRFRETKNGADFGLVMQCGEQEVHWVKQQPVDIEEESGRHAYGVHRILIAHSIAGYLSSGFSGLFMPCAYLRKKETGLVESGIAYCGTPSPGGPETQVVKFGGTYDRPFGAGFTNMLIQFIETLKATVKETGISMYTTIGLDIRLRSQLGALGFDLMVVGPHVVCLKTAISPQDPIWTVLRSMGISEVFHVPSVPLGIPESDLRFAKPQA